MHRFAVLLATAVLGFTVAAYAEVAASPPVVDQPKCVGCGFPDIEVHYRVPFANIVSGTQTFDIGTTTVGTPVTFDNSPSARPTAWTISTSVRSTCPSASPSLPDLLFRERS